MSEIVLNERSGFQLRSFLKYKLLMACGPEDITAAHARVNKLLRKMHVEFRKNPDNNEAILLISGKAIDYKRPWTIRDFNAIEALLKPNRCKSFTLKGILVSAVSMFNCRQYRPCKKVSVSDVRNLRLEPAAKIS